ncbi:MAG: PE PGRS family protein, partial [Mycolicibacterium aromaticivorans]|nr:PE PGRS family protein [Mycolicibacterium aromaticivorans]
VDSAGNIDVANSGAGTVSVISAEGKIVKTIAVGPNPQAIAVNSAGYAYVTNGGTGTVSVINPAGVVINSINLAAFAYGVAISPTGANAGNVYITTLSGAVSVISA